MVSAMNKDECGILIKIANGQLRMELQLPEELSGGSNATPASLLAGAIIIKYTNEATGNQAIEEAFNSAFEEVSH